MMDITPQEFAAIINNGERVTHLNPNDCYYAHLAIYYFALPFVQGKHVLDAGCGTGYGSAYLADHGAAFVDGIDIGESAIAFDKKSFRRPNLRYQEMDLEAIQGFPNRSFDVIFSSNVLEHVPNVQKFFRKAVRLLKKDGVFILCVPLIIDETTRKINIDNPFHLNIWTLRQWNQVLEQYFGQVETYLYGFSKEGIILDLNNAPEQTVVRENDFDFEPCTLDTFYQKNSIGPVFVARNPKWLRPAFLDKIHFMEGSFTRPLPTPPVPARPENLTLVGKARHSFQTEGVTGLAKRAIRHLVFRINRLLGRG